MVLNIPYQIPSADQKKIWEYANSETKEKWDDLAEKTGPDDKVAMEMWDTFYEKFPSKNFEEYNKTGKFEDITVNMKEVNQIKKKMKKTADSFTGDDAKKANEIYSLYEKSLDIYTDPNSKGGSKFTADEEIELADHLEEIAKDIELPIHINMELEV